LKNLALIIFLVWSSWLRCGWRSHWGTTTNWRAN